MAENAHTPETLADKIEAIRVLSDQANAQARRATHLIGAIDDLTDQLADLSDRSDRARERRANAVDRVMVFCELAKEAAEQAADNANTVNGLANDCAQDRATTLQMRGAVR